MRVASPMPAWYRCGWSVFLGMYRSISSPSAPNVRFLTSRNVLYNNGISFSLGRYERPRPEWISTFTGSVGPPSQRKGMSTKSISDAVVIERDERFRWWPLTRSQPAVTVRTVINGYRVGGSPAFNVVVFGKPCTDGVGSVTSGVIVGIDEWVKYRGACPRGVAVLVAGPKPIRLPAGECTSHWPPGRGRLERTPQRPVSARVGRSTTARSHRWHLRETRVLIGVVFLRNCQLVRRIGIFDPPRNRARRDGGVGITRTVVTPGVTWFGTRRVSSSSNSPIRERPQGRRPAFSVETMRRNTAVIKTDPPVGETPGDGAIPGTGLRTASSAIPTDVDIDNTSRSPELPICRLGGVMEDREAVGHTVRVLDWRVSPRESVSSEAVVRHDVLGQIRAIG